MAAAPFRLCFLQHLLDLSFGAAVGHAGPVGGMAEDRTDLLVGKLAEDSEGEHLLVRLFQPVEALVDGKSGVFVDEQFGCGAAAGGNASSSGTVCFALRQWE